MQGVPEPQLGEKTPLMDIWTGHQSPRWGAPSHARGVRAQAEGGRCGWGRGEETEPSEKAPVWIEAVAYERGD